MVPHSEPPCLEAWDPRGAVAPRYRVGTKGGGKVTAVGEGGEVQQSLQGMSGAALGEWSAQLDPVGDGGIPQHTPWQCPQSGERARLQ